MWHGGTVLGSARLGSARLGSARLGSARLDRIRAKKSERNGECGGPAAYAVEAGMGGRGQESPRGGRVPTWVAISLYDMPGRFFSFWTMMSRMCSSVMPDVLAART